MQANFTLAFLVIFSEMTSSNKIENSHADYTILAVSGSSQCIPLLKPLPENLFFLFFKKGCNIITIVKCRPISTPNKIN